MNIKAKALQSSPSPLTAAAPDAGYGGAEYSLRMHPPAKRRSEERSGAHRQAVLCVRRCCFHQHCVYNFTSQWTPLALLLVPFNPRPSSLPFAVCPFSRNMLLCVSVCVRVCTRAHAPFRPHFRCSGLSQPCGRWFCFLPSLRTRRVEKLWAPLGTWHAWGWELGKESERGACIQRRWLPLPPISCSIASDQAWSWRQLQPCSGS